MTAGYAFDLSGARLVALPSGALHWPGRGLLVVSDLHLGRSARLARRGGALLPPYEGAETLARLAAEIAATAPAGVICLGDSFDDAAGAAAPDAADCAALGAMMRGRDWVWIAGNHDPGPVAVGGRPLPELRVGPLVFRHQAQASARGEVSGHFHPKARMVLAGQRIARRCFMVDSNRVILPAFGAYTGGLSCDDPAVAGLMGPDAVAVLCGSRALAVAMPRRKGPLPRQAASP